MTKKLINALLVLILVLGLCTPSIMNPDITSAVDYNKDSTSKTNNNINAGVTLELSKMIQDSKKEEIEISSINDQIPVTGVGVVYDDTDENENEVEEEELPYEEVDPYTAWVGYSWLNLREGPSKDTKILDQLAPNTELNVVGETTDGWLAVDIDDKVAYVYGKYVTDEENSEASTYNNDWTGEKLTKRAGRVTGPSGVETYYNLNMSGCVKLMNSKGYYADRIWVRSDGAKMWDNYVMVAADLNKYPKGTIVNTSLGKGIVVDTGSFTTNGSGVTFDVATAW